MAQQELQVQPVQLVPELPALLVRQAQPEITEQRVAQELRAQLAQPVPELQVRQVPRETMELPVPLVLQVLV
jgi:hypothetical protein